MQTREKNINTPKETNKYADDFVSAAAALAAAAAFAAAAFAAVAVAFVATIFAVVVNDVNICL